LTLPKLFSMSTSNQSYKQLTVPYFKEIFDIIDQIMISRGHPYYLIGANAVALELLQDGIPPYRGTKDIDFAVMISNMDEYDDLMAEVVKNGFNAIKDVPHRVYHPGYNVAIDILPFGQVEQEFTVRFSDRKTELHVLGFSEVMKNPKEIKIEDATILIPPLPGMLLLKLVAWADRPDRRGHDIHDILRIIENYYDHNQNEILEHHYDTFPEEEEEFDKRQIGAQVLGREIKKYLDQSPELAQNIKELIKQNLVSPETSKVVKEWSRILDTSIDYALSILEALKKGVEE
jgi:predicted nucleotidyltransferase